MLANTNGLSWRLQDAKAQFSAVVEGALRGVPQHITRRGKQAVVVLSEQDFAVLQNVPIGRSLSFIQHLCAMPTEPVSGQTTAAKRQKHKAATGVGATARAPRSKFALRDLDL